VSDQGTAIALSLVLLAVSIVVLVLLRDHWFGGLRDTHR
jgi:ABC-type sulfate transport system permease component